MLAVYGVARNLGLAPATIIAGFHSFAGLAHRQQYVATLGTITFINDSKATNADAAAKALATFDSIYWIIGGIAKEGGIEGLEAFYPRLRAVYTIGQNAPLLAAQLMGSGLTVTSCKTLERATHAAYSDAQREGLSGATVLLSPACASFDQFQSFEDRGTQFIKLVESLKT
jgi:UDP-N-acetylmuramoylalanine--D-glutamate ligase